MNNKMDGWRERWKERAKRDWHAYARTNRWTDSLNRQTDGQMALLLGQAGFDETDKQTSRLRQTDAQTRRTRALLGRAKWADREMNRLDILM